MHEGAVSVAATAATAASTARPVKRSRERSKRRRERAEARGGPPPVWLLTDEEGALVACATAARSYRSYEAVKPSAAAVKAFNAYVRSVDGRAALEAHLARSPPLVDAPLPRAVLDEDAAATTAVGVRAAEGTVGADVAASYVAARAKVPLATYAFCVRLSLRSESARGGVGRVRTYHVLYHAVTTPNAHEMRCGIVKVARATLVRNGSAGGGGAPESGDSPASAPSSVSPAASIGGGGGDGGVAAGGEAEVAPSVVLHQRYGTLGSVGNVLARRRRRAAEAAAAAGAVGSAVAAAAASPSDTSEVTPSPDVSLTASSSMDTLSDVDGAPPTAASAAAR